MRRVSGEGDEATKEEREIGREWEGIGREESVVGETVNWKAKRERKQGGGVNVMVCTYGQRKRKSREDLMLKEKSVYTDKYGQTTRKEAKNEKRTE